MQIIIVTRWRSGSSFTGEIFNRNPQFAYFFEPLFDPDEKPIDTKKILILKDVASCDISSALTSWKVWPGSWDYFGPLLHTTASQMKVRQKNISAFDSAVSEACHRRQYVAVKTVHIPDIGNLQSLVSDPKLNVKILPSP